ncbi:MAG TPA: SWIM zinc finger family protein [Polyangiaceae bacterium]
MSCAHCQNGIVVVNTGSGRLVASCPCISQDERQAKGRALAENKAARPLSGGIWLVRSSSSWSGGAGYVVDTTKETCNCPDFERRKAKCKHMWAVEFTRASAKGTSS